MGFHGKFIDLMDSTQVRGIILVVRGRGRGEVNVEFTVKATTYSAQVDGERFLR